MYLVVYHTLKLVIKRDILYLWTTCTNFILYNFESTAKLCI